ncbi:leucine-rich repeat domain-containing protein [Ascoidea rubescens DSM 1968]|uniref:L domain-like protein n=1 Tax=Ascoidea rubescens DSM 1968 TaxID=1344418 RepID=A0A1D2VGC0_9ASCO|nr:L domain-like protein [Ascoidea rubescens DSM 1968]ODV60714.1 L domain-like protein [Ascoidea rubescens DSM 1968]
MYLEPIKKSRQNELEGLPPHILKNIFTKLSFKHRFLFISSLNSIVKATCLQLLFEKIEFISCSCKNYGLTVSRKIKEQVTLKLNLKDATLFKKYLNQFSRNIYFKIDLPNQELLKRHQDITTLLSKVRKIAFLVQNVSLYDYTSPCRSPILLAEFWKCISLLKDILLYHKKTLNAITINFDFGIINNNFPILFSAYNGLVHEESRIYRFDSKYLFSDEYVNYGLFNLKKLDLDGMVLTKIGSGVLNLNNLKYFQLRNNNFGNLKKIQFPEGLRYLFLNLSGITCIKNVSFLNNLVKLILSGNKITTFDNLSGCENLVQLNLDGNSISKINNVSQFKNLRRLYLQYNSINCIKNLSSLSNLEELFLDHNLIDNIQTLKYLSNLKVLELSFNSIQSIDNCFDGFVSLQTLILINNHIIKIGVFPTKLMNLKAISFSHNRITKIENLDNLINLNSLNLSHNRITKIENLDNSINLNSLNLLQNQITKIENLDSLVNLTSLNLSRNRLNIVENIEKLVNISVINLSNNWISDLKIMENEAHLENLTEVNLSNNRIFKMDNLGCFKNLRTLDLSNNLIKVLIPINQLNSCSYINLESNAIDQIVNESRNDRMRSILKTILREKNTFPLQESTEMTLNLMLNPLTRMNGLSKWSNLTHLILPESISGIDKRDLSQLRNMKEMELPRRSNVSSRTLNKLKKKFPNLKIKFIRNDFGASQNRPGFSNTTHLVGRWVYVERNNNHS